MLRFPCPKCNRLLFQSGEIPMFDRTFPIFSCDECLANVEMFGKMIEIAYTFAINERGVPFDPASPDGSLPDYSAGKIAHLANFGCRPYEPVRAPVRLAPDRTR